MRPLYRGSGEPCFAEGRPVMLGAPRFIGEQLRSIGDETSR
jgi:hypothetical protein